MTSYSWLKGRLPTCIMLVVCLAFIPGSVLAADVDVYAEGAYTDSDLVVYIYADINAGPILSFGVKVNYPAGLTFDPSNSSQNKAEWYFGESSPGYDYMPPEDDGTGVVLIGGKLDTDAPIEGVEGSRKLLGILTFTHSGFPFGHPINDPAPISVELGRVSPYENFVGTGGALLDGSTGFTSVIIARRGDANADGVITNVDMGTVRNIILGRVPGVTYRCYADADASGSVTNVDMGEIRNIILGN